MGLVGCDFSSGFDFLIPCYNPYVSKGLKIMEWVSSSGGDVELNVDLESGGTTSEEDATQNQDLRADRFSKLIHSEEDGKVMNSDETYYGTSQDKKIDKEKHKKKKPLRPWKPPRPPGGPCLGAPDQKLFTEISELNLKRKRMERIRMLRKLKMDKPLSLNRNLVACLVTIIFFLVILYEGLLGSRT